MTVANNKNRNTYRFQPELATSIIYWSVTFGSFFVSLIAVLEQFSVTLISLSFFLLFLLLSFLGQKRHFKLTTETLFFMPVVKVNQYEIKIEEIEKIAVGAYGITFYGAQFDERPLEDKAFLMLPKTKDAFITALETHEKFSGEIVGIKKSVGL